MGIDLIKSITSDTVITAKQANDICEYIKELEALAEIGKAYKGHLLAEIERYSLIIMPGINAKQFCVGCSAMDIDELKKFEQSLEKKAAEILPVSPQIKSHSCETKNNNFNAFMI